MYACSIGVVALPRYIHAALVPSSLLVLKALVTCILTQLLVQVFPICDFSLPSGLSHIYSVIVLNTEQALKQFTASGPKFKFGAGLEVGRVLGPAQT